MKNRAAYFGVFTALALILSYVETLIPVQFGIPGIKLGLANLVVVIAKQTGKRLFCFLYQEYCLPDLFSAVFSV